MKGTEGMAECLVDREGVGRREISLSGDQKEESGKRRSKKGHVLAGGKT